MRGFIVAMEYLGAGLGAGAGGHRVPVCEHQYIVRDLIVTAIAAITGFDDCPSSANSSPPM